MKQWVSQVKWITRYKNICVGIYNTLGLSAALRRASSSTAIAPAGAYFSAGTSPPSRCSGKGRSVFRRDFHTYTLESESFLYTHTHTHAICTYIYILLDFRSYLSTETPLQLCVRIMYILYCTIVLCSERANTLRQRFLRVFRERDPRTEIAREIRHG